MIKHLPKPFLDDIVNGQCIPVIGAGFSLNAILDGNKRMPLWDTLGSEIGKLIPGYRYAGALDALSAYEHEYSRVKLVEELRKLLHIDESHPGATHRSFCKLPFEIVCTTNFDFLLERAYATLGRPCRPMAEEDQLSIVVPPPAVTLLKLHGDLHHPARMVATEEDYDAFVGRYPLVATYLANLLISKTVWFIGYSLDDPDFRLIWQIVTDRLGRLRRPAYTVRVGAQSSEISRFERRGVRVLNLPGDPSKDYGTALDTLFSQLWEHWDRATAQRGAGMEEESLAELVLPKEANTRLCFFLVPRDVAGFYRRRIYPIAEKYGFTPVTIDDLVGPEDSTVARLLSLIQRSEYILLDVSARATMLEAGMVFAQRKDASKVLIIRDPDADLPLEWLNRMRLVRPSNLSDDQSDDFLAKIETWFQKESDNIKPLLDEEPRRLLDKREWRSAVISAIALVEYELRRRLSSEETDRVPSYLPLTRLLRAAAANGIIKPAELEQLNHWIRLRNEAVHMKAEVDSKAARAAVNGVYRLLKRWSDPSNSTPGLVPE